MTQEKPKLSNFNAISNTISNTWFFEIILKSIYAKPSYKSNLL